MKVDGLNTTHGINDTSDDFTSFDIGINPNGVDLQTDYSEATGLIQMIVTEKLTQDVIRKMPSDEYLQLLSLLDEMISGSINKEV